MCVSLPGPLGGFETSSVATENIFSRCFLPLGLLRIAQGAMSGPVASTFADAYCMNE